MRADHVDFAQNSPADSMSRQLYAAAQLSLSTVQWLLLRICRQFPRHASTTEVLSRCARLPAPVTSFKAMCSTWQAVSSAQRSHQPYTQSSHD
jgi:hypothetical protein